MSEICKSVEYTRGAVYREKREKAKQKAREERRSNKGRIRSNNNYMWIAGGIL